MVVVGNNKSTTMKNAGKSLAISVAMRIKQLSPDGAHPGLNSKPLDAAIG
jgi:hypothetical protein